MVKFLRNVRQNLISNDNTAKYIKYAIGEIFLVVIGILIALQINTLNEVRKENRKEQKVLRQLRKEFESDLTQLKTKIELRKQMIIDLKDCLKYFEEQSVPNDSIFESKLTSLILPLTFDPIQDELVSSGRIKIIKNETLKTHLTNWTTEVQELIETEKLFETHYMNSTIPFFERHGYSRQLVSRLWKDSTKSTFLLGGNKHNMVEIGGSKLSTNFDTLLQNKQLESIIANAYSLSLINANESEKLKSDILIILDLLELEIKH